MSTNGQMRMRAVVSTTLDAAIAQRLYAAAYERRVSLSQVARDLLLQAIERGLLNEGQTTQTAQRDVVGASAD